MLIYGKDIRENIKKRIAEAATHHPMSISVVRVGEDKSSAAYIKGIVKFAGEIGVKSHIYQLPPAAREQEIIDLIHTLNEDPAVTGIMLQTPLPPGLNVNRLINHIQFSKDVEGIHYYNFGRLINQEIGVRPSTPKAIISMLDGHEVDIAGQKVVIVGRSTILGTPLALMMIARDGTVTVCHSKTRDLARETREADILIAALGKARYITADMVKENAVIIDAGINFDETGAMCGDVDEEAKARARLASAVPGGVGVITVAELFDNLRILAEQKKS